MISKQNPKQPSLNIMWYSCRRFKWPFIKRLIWMTKKAKNHWCSLVLTKCITQSHNMGKCSYQATHWNHKCWFYFSFLKISQSTHMQGRITKGFIGLQRNWANKQNWFFLGFKNLENIRPKRKWNLNSIPTIRKICVPNFLINSNHSFGFT